MFDGRGRYYRFGTKTLLSELLALDMRDFTRWADLNDWSFGSLNWTAGNGHKSSIGYQVQPGLGVRLMYTNNKTEELDYIVKVTTTTCNLGGVRYWWLCPRCNRRCRVLHCNRLFVCHRCTGTYYETQKNKDILTRIDNELTAIRRKLKAQKTLAVTDRLPNRPKGMHYKTFFRLGKRYNDLQYYRMLSIGIDVARMGEAMGIRTGGSAEDMEYQLRWLMQHEDGY